MLTNADMTVYHLAEDEDGQGESWIRTVIRGVCWQEKAAVHAENGGAGGADSVRVYLPRSSWSAADPPCRCEDRIARGIRRELTPPEDARAVTAVSDKDMGRSVRHWAVAAV